jgi:DNA-directed RNA polymerase subunit M/transcription elongation factor TFIIS
MDSESESSVSSKEESEVEEEEVEEDVVEEEIEEAEEEEDGGANDEDDLGEGDDDNEVIKVDASSKIEVGDLDKIKRNYLKKNFSNPNPISKTTKKKYKDIEVPERSETYKYDDFENIRELGETVLCSSELEDEVYKIVEKISDDCETYAYTCYQLLNCNINYFINHVNNLEDFEEVSLYDMEEFLNEKNTNMKKTMYLIEKPKIEDSVEPCGKCKSKTVSFFSLQTRGGDEPATTFFTCLTCGAKWKN